MVFAQGISSPSLANLSTLSASACVSAPVALPRTLGGSTTLSLLAEDDSPAVLVDAGRSRTSESGLGGATPVPVATSAPMLASIAKCGPAVCVGGGYETRRVALEEVISK